MKNNLITILVFFLCFLPVVSSEVSIQLGEDYTDIENISLIKFIPHPNYYDICAEEKTTIPILIKNLNLFTDIFHFSIDKNYASLSSKNTILKTKESGILLLSLDPPDETEENTTISFTIITEKEAIKRVLKIRTNIRKCYSFNVSFEKNFDELCPCEEKLYNLIIENKINKELKLNLSVDAPIWANLSLNDTISVLPNKKIEVPINIVIPCSLEGEYNILIKTRPLENKITKTTKLYLDVLPKDKCYNAVISVKNVDLSYYGKSIPIKIENKGTKGAVFHLSIKGIDWYSLTQEYFFIESKQKKIVNLNLIPNNSIIPGEYYADIILSTNHYNLSKTLRIRLRNESTILNKTISYINYYRYYLALFFVLFLLILLFIFIKRKSPRLKKEAKSKKERVMPKEIKRIIKLENKRQIFIFLLFLLFFLLVLFSLLRYRTFYNRILNLISSFFIERILPYGVYIRYVFVSFCILMILLLIFDFLKKTKKKPKKARSKIIEIKRVTNKKLSKKKIKLLTLVYVTAVIILFLLIIGYTIYKFKTIRDLIVYLGIPLSALGIIAILMASIRKKKIKFLSIAATLIIISGIIYALFYYNLISSLKQFIVLYYFYFVLGFIILVITIFVIRFYYSRKK